MFCPNCGTRLPEGAKFCASCGAQVDAAPAPTPTVSGVPTPAGKSRKTKWIVLAAALVVVIAVVVILLVTLGGDGGAKDIEAVIDKYFDAFEDNNTKAIVKLYPAQLYEFYEDMYDGDEEGFLKSVDRCYIFYSLEVEHWEVSDLEYLSKSWVVNLAETFRARGVENLKITDAAGVKVHATFESDWNGDICFSMVKTGGEWYLWDVRLLGEGLSHKTDDV